MTWWNFYLKEPFQTNLTNYLLTDLLKSHHNLVPDRRGPESGGPVLLSFLMLYMCAVSEILLVALGGSHILLSVHFLAILEYVPMLSLWQAFWHLDAGYNHIFLLSKLFARVEWPERYPVEDGEFHPELKVCVSQWIGFFCILENSRIPAKYWAVWLQN